MLIAVSYFLSDLIYRKLLISHKMNGFADTQHGQKIFKGNAQFLLHNSAEIGGITADGGGYLCQIQFPVA